MHGSRPGVSARPRSIALAALALATLALAIVNPHARAADVPGPATRFSTSSPQMLVAEQIARDTWGYDPCNGRVTITWTALEPGYDATSTWTNATVAYADPAANYACRVEFNSEMTYDWQKFCTVFVHEFGHLTGHLHSADPNDVMAPVYSAVLPACRNTPEPGAAPDVPAAPVVVSRTATATKVKTRSTKASRTAAARGRARLAKAAGHRTRWVTSDH